MKVYDFSKMLIISN